MFVGSTCKTYVNSYLTYVYYFVKERDNTVPVHKAYRFESVGVGR